MEPEWLRKGQSWQKEEEKIGGKSLKKKQRRK